MRQYWQSFWTILKIALPDGWLRRTSGDAPETHSEQKFPEREPREVHGKRYGLRSALKGRSAAAT